MDQVISFIWLACDIYQWIILIYVLMSWLPAVRESFIGEILGKICEPYLSIFRRFIPPIGGMLDVSPIVAYLVLPLVARGIETVLRAFS